MGGHVKHVSPFWFCNEAPGQTAAASGKPTHRHGERKRSAEERGMTEEDRAPKGGKDPKKKKEECNSGVLLRQR